jgi:hypothetical protein
MRGAVGLRPLADVFRQLFLPVGGLRSKTAAFLKHSRHFANVVVMPVNTRTNYAQDLFVCGTSFCHNFWLVKYTRFVCQRIVLKQVLLENIEREIYKEGVKLKGEIGSVPCRSIGDV